MARLPRLLAGAAVLIGIALPSFSTGPSRAAGRIAAPGGALAIQASPVTPNVAAGDLASLFVHAPAFTHLILQVGYPDATVQLLQGAADPHGRYVFTWPIPANMPREGAATLALSGERGDERGAWSGTLNVRPMALPPLFVRAVADRFLAGTPLEVFVGSTPDTPFSYTARTPDGTSVMDGSSRTDARGRAVISQLDTYLPRHAVAVQIAVTISRGAASRTTTEHFTLLPRPALPLFVSATNSAVHAGQPFSVFVSSAPQAAISVTVSLTSTAIAQGSGTTDSHGRWVYTTNLNVTLAHPEQARIVVHADRGIDAAISRAAFLLRPALPGIFDRLAGPSNPAPTLARYFTQLPDRVIMISTESQTLRVYDRGALIHEDYVTTGRPELPTPHGVFQVSARYSPYEFISPWPVGSPYYYPPSPVHFAMLFRDGGYFLHDAPWRTVYGPRTNLPHYDSDPGEPLGSHGCVNIPYADMLWLWKWATIGTTVVVY